MFERRRPPRRMEAILRIASVAVLFLTPALAQETLVVKARRLYTGTGEVVENGVVILASGKISASGSGLAVPAGARILEAAAVTPGILDAGSLMGISGRSVEAGREITPTIRAVDGIDFESPAFDRALALGITTVYVAPSGQNLIGGLGAVVKTAAARRIVREAAGLRAAMGSEPSMGNIPARFGMPDNLYFRRPTTRMGVVWGLRDAFYDTKAYLEARARDASVAPDPEMEILAQALRGEILLRVTARKRFDILTALRISQEFEEFDLRVAIDHGTESYKLAELLREKKVPVILGPLYHYPGNDPLQRREGDESRLATAAILEKAGVRFAFGSGSASPSDLREYAAFSVRYGLSPEAAMRALTASAAEILEVSERVGTIEKGKDADLVLLSGDPLAGTTRVTTVIVDGVIAWPRAGEETPEAGAP